MFLFTTEPRDFKGVVFVDLAVFALTLYTDFKTQFRYLSKLQSSSKLQQATTLIQRWLHCDDVMMTSSTDLLLIFEYLTFAHSLCTVYWICTRFLLHSIIDLHQWGVPNFGRKLLAERKRNRIFSSLLFYLIYTQEWEYQIIFHKYVFVYDRTTWL
mgnify:CR=1 FL=1